MTTEHINGTTCDYRRDPTFDVAGCIAAPTNARIACGMLFIDRRDLEVAKLFGWRVVCDHPSLGELAVVERDLAAYYRACFAAAGRGFD